MMVDSHRTDIIRRKYHSLDPLLDERLRRLWVAAEAREIGWGGVTVVSLATGLSQTTIATGLRELQAGVTAGKQKSGGNRVRWTGGGRTPLTEHDQRLRQDLETLVGPVPRGDPESPLRWTCKSTRNLAQGLKQQGHTVGYRTVAAVLLELGYSLQSNRKAREGLLHPDRHARN